MINLVIKCLQRTGQRTGQGTGHVNIYIPKNQLFGVGFLKKSKTFSYVTANSNILYL